MKNIMNIIEKEIITEDELIELEESSEVTNISNNGYSSRSDMLGYLWFTVTLDNEEYSLYVKYN